MALNIRQHYESDTRKLQLQSEMDILDLPEFMRQKWNILPQEKDSRK